MSKLQDIKAPPHLKKNVFHTVALLELIGSLAQLVFWVMPQAIGNMIVTFLDKPRQK